ncbi:MarR family winged helix-turn-helix transcriptional regulator [Kutzneria chonburiensis]|uniref:MarR family winged helix-turn-helix transcriptional regulator n=1 Tax=Kutzneria chonburiensis TaxID=1483604 RepID=A0ABV6N1P0_9PSEU
MIADELMTTVMGLKRVVRRRMEVGRPEPRLRGAHTELLRVVRGNPGIGVAAAAKELHLAGNTVSTLVNQLIDKELLRRETDPDDRRAARLYLTPKAVKRQAKWREDRTKLVEGALKELNARERAAIEKALPALRKLLDELGGEGTGA